MGSGLSGPWFPTAPTARTKSPVQSREAVLKGWPLPHGMRVSAGAGIHRPVFWDELTRVSQSLARIQKGRRTLFGEIAVSAAKGDSCRNCRFSIGGSVPGNGWRSASDCDRRGELPTDVLWRTELTSTRREGFKQEEYLSKQVVPVVRAGKVDIRLKLYGVFGLPKGKVFQIPAVQMRSFGY
jgi:hypothetical protein